MKHIIILLTLTFSISAMSKTKLLDNPIINNLFEEMSIELDNFENPWYATEDGEFEGKIQNCKAVTSEHLIDYLNDKLLGLEELNLKGMDEVQKVIGKRDFIYCSSHDIKMYWDITYHYYISIDKEIKIRFEDAYEN